MNNTPIVTLTGPSGTGKSTIESYLAHHFGWLKAVSHTTREPRPDEEPGEDYYFVSGEEFDKITRKGGWIEHITFVGNKARYGISVSEIDRLSGMSPGLPIVIVCEPEGAAQIKKWCAAAGRFHYAAYLDTPVPELFARLCDRAGDEMESLTEQAIDEDRDVTEEETVATIERAVRRMHSMVTVERHWSRIGGLFDCIYESPEDGPFALAKSIVRSVNYYHGEWQKKQAQSKSVQNEWTGPETNGKALRPEPDAEPEGTAVITVTGEELEEELGKRMLAMAEKHNDRKVNFTQPLEINEHTAKPLASLLIAALKGTPFKGGTLRKD